MRAVGRGFSPKRAYRLMEDNIYLDVIDIRDYAGKSRKRVRVLRGRVIGREGKTRRLIEELSGAQLSIYGNTVSIIGGLESMSTARSAVEMLLNGSEHSTVYRYLERYRRYLKETQLDTINLEEMFRA